MTTSADEIANSVGGITFDTGGTIFDWYAGVLAALSETGRRLGIDADWSAMTMEWRRLSTTMVNDGLPLSGGRATMDMDDVLAKTLDQVLDKYSLADLPASERTELVRAWRELDAWSDVATGLPRLRERFITAPFTILNTKLVIAASRRGRLNWDCIVSCEMIGIYKTHPDTYATTARWLGLEPQNILMVTTHNNDLRAAHACGYRTAYVYRPKEWGPIPSLDPEPDPVADLVCNDLDDLANQLGCPSTGDLGKQALRIFRPAGSAA
jgi:2-haloacid dehalogenase